MSWWIPGLSFVGALVGAAIPAWVNLRGQHQDARSEWRQRFDRAVDLATSDQPGQQRIGDELLTELMESDLGSDDDRALARRVAEIRVHQRAESDGDTVAIDLGGILGDNGSDEQEASP